MTTLRHPFFEEVRKIPPDALFSYEGESFRKHYSDDLFTYCFCFTDKGFYTFFNTTIVTYIPTEILKEK